jgi:serine-type D-Ala-D-Ala carboxypeptidase/endopeptidase (penicillin-binding protein 4)
MLELVSSGLMGVWLNAAGVDTKNLSPAEFAAWQGMPWVTSAQPIEPSINGTIDRYFATLKAQGLDPNAQAVWLRTDSMQAFDRRSHIPVPVASLTKTATSLAALATYGLEKRFDTFFSSTGKVKNGVLVGDLIVQGGGDPLFVWEDAIEIGRRLQELGIRQVQGNLLIVGNFHMNYKSDPQTAGNLLKQGLGGENLPSELKAWIDKDVNVVKLPEGGGIKQAKPAPLAITGQAIVTTAPPANATPLIRYQSLKLVEIVRQMNIYSNNEIAQILADSVGGAEKVMDIAAVAAQFPRNEIQLVNGSGLGEQNQISPRAVGQIFRTLHQIVQPAGLTIGDLFPVAGGVKIGTLKDRNLPAGVTMKTGTLNAVSALTGVLPTRDRGLVWFTIVNKGWQIPKLRQQQDVFLQDLLKTWGAVKPPLATARHDRSPAYFGDPNRSQILLKQN